jgi:hypothetical protein
VHSIIFLYVVNFFAFFSIFLNIKFLSKETIFASEERELIVSKRHAPAVVARHRRHHHHRRHAGDVGVGTESERLSFFNHF